MTKARTPIKVGDLIRNNDPRSSNRPRRIIAIETRVTIYGTTEFACLSGHPSTRIRLDRIHTDGKPRHSGYSLAKE